MNIQIASDLHIEFLQRRFPGYRVIAPAPEADVLVIAGDIHCGTKAVETFADWPVPVVYIHGNHEAYNEDYAELVDKMRAAAAGTNVHYLEQNEYIFDDVRFLGCCLWTDYCLNPESRQAAMAEAESILNDHRLIRFGARNFSAQDALAQHQESRIWLEAKLNEQFDGSTVVVTHHAPHPKSIHPRYAGMQINTAFISDLTPLIEKADLWIHGHVHDSFDYEVARARVVANPRGYALNRRAVETPAQLEWENATFESTLTVRV